MSRSPRSTSTPGALRRRVAVLALLFLLAAPTAQAESDHFEWLERLQPDLEQPLFRPNEDWRARGIAYIDLPLQIRARFDASYTRFLTAPDHLAVPMVAEVGPGLRYDRQIQSRIALTRPVMEGIELEVVWETRNRVEAGDPMGFGRQIVGAMIRITP